MSFKLNRENETEVFVNQGGGITILQQDEFHGEIMVVLSIKQFKEIVKNAKGIMSGEFDEEDEK